MDERNARRRDESSFERTWRKTTVKNPTMYQNPNMAMIEAEKWNSMAGTYANGISSVTNGQMSNVFGEMAMVNSTMGNELDMMIDKGNYVGGTYEFTVPRKVSVADRDFMYSQITNLVLKGMPVTVKNVGQINAQSEAGNRGGYQCSHDVLSAEKELNERN